MKQAIHQIFARWGQSLTVAGQETRAFLQPVRTQGERMPGGMSGSGWLDGRRWHYLGEVPVEAGESIVWNGKAFRVCSSRPYAVGEMLCYWWASLEQETV